MNKIMFILWLMPQMCFALTAKEIMIKNDQARKLPGCEAHAKLTTKGPEAPERVKEFTWWRKLTADGAHSNTLTRFHFPPEVKGEGILFLERGKGQNDVQLFLPNLKKIRRVETDQQSSSFMGSEFSYSDIAEPHLDDYNYTLDRQEKCPGLASKQCYVIVSVPASGEVKAQNGSTGGTSWIRLDNFMVAHAEYKDIEGAPWKTLDISDTQEVDTPHHKWMATKLKMINVKTKHETGLTFDNVKVSETILTIPLLYKISLVRSNFFLFLCFLCSTALGADADQATPFHLLPLSGRIFSDVYVPTHNNFADTPLQQFSTSIWLESAPQWSPSWSSKFIYEGDGFDGQFSYATGQHPGTHFESRLREGYIEYNKNGFDFRFGEQIIAWGKSDGVNPTDYHSAKNYSFFNPDDEVRRVGSLSTQIAFTPSEGNSPWTYTLVWTVIPATSQFLFPPALLPANVTIGAAQAPPVELANSEGGGKVAYNGAGWDASLSGFSGYSHLPEIQEQSFLPGAVPLVGLTQVYQKVWAVGADGSYSTERWVFRGESAYMQTPNSDGNNPLMQPSHWDTVLGAERSLGGNFRGQAQVLMRYFPNLTAASQATGPDPVSTSINQTIATANALLLQYQYAARPGFTLRLAYDDEKRGFNSEIFYLQNLNGGDFVVRPQVSYSWTDLFKTSVGSEIYGGPATTPLGSLSPYTSVFFEAKYTF